jgi:hypothetical protein
MIYQFFMKDDIPILIKKSPTPFEKGKGITFSPSGVFFWQRATHNTPAIFSAISIGRRRAQIL